MDTQEASSHWPPVLHQGGAEPRILFTRPIFNRLNWITRPAFLRSGKSRSLLFVGPWLGEFGWELMNWQAWARKVSTTYTRTVVCARESSRALYADFCDEFISHELTATANCHVGFDIQPESELHEILETIPREADHLVPRRFVPRSHQKFIRFGSARAEPAVDVLIHARGRGFIADRNWRGEDWQALCDQLADRGIRVGAIGLSSATLPVDRVVDLRDGSLQETMDHMRSARLVVGPSSGPMHLASLCGAPHLVWTDRQSYSMRKSSREKYERWWNPLGTPVTVIDEFGFSPPVNTIRDEVLRLVTR